MDMVCKKVAILVVGIGLCSLFTLQVQAEDFIRPQTKQTNAYSATTTSNRQQSQLQHIETRQTLLKRGTVNENVKFKTARDADGNIIRQDIMHYQGNTLVKKTVEAYRSEKITLKTIDDYANSTGTSTVYVYDQETSELVKSIKYNYVTIDDVSVLSGSERTFYVYDAGGRLIESREHHYDRYHIPTGDRYRNVYEYTYSARGALGNVVSERYKYQYNEETEDFDYVGITLKIVFDYNIINGDLWRTTVVNYTGSKESDSTSYNAKGNVISKSSYTYGKNGKLLDRTVFEYDPSGKIKKRKVHEYDYNDNGIFAGYTLTEYNGSSNIPSTSSYHADFKQLI